MSAENMREALEAAAKSLETISMLSGRDEFMTTMEEVRGYAKSRAAIASEALASQAAPALSQRHDWIACPVCAEPDMRRDLFDEGLVIVQCTNHACASNGGQNQSALPQQSAQGEAVADSEYHLSVLRELSATLVNRSAERHQAVEWALSMVTAPPAPARAIADLDSIIRDLEGGFVRCGSCGDQEDTKDLDIVGDLKRLRSSMTAVPDDVAKDAARYRWIRREDQKVPGPCAYAPWAGPPMFGDELDGAIDTAMLAATPEVPRG